jgi:hypothetical protein
MMKKISAGHASRMGEAIKEKGGRHHPHGLCGSDTSFMFRERNFPKSV